MTVEELVAAMQAIIDEATASEASGGPGLTDPQAARYEELEGQLARARKTEEIQRRHAALKAPAPGQPIHTAAAPKVDTLERAWMHYMRTGQENSDIQELRAQSEMVGSEGGYLVPETFRQKIVEKMVAFGGLSNVVENYSTGDGSPVRWATLDDTANSGEIVAENAAPVGGADLVFGEANLGAYKYVAVGAGGLPLRLSVELVQDSAFDITGKLTTWLGRRMERKLAVDLVRGSGVSEPQGITTGRTGIQTASNAALTYADLLKYIHSVDPAYRDGARWAMNDASLAVIQGLVDTTGRPLLTNALAGVEDSPGGARLLGYPVVIDQAFPTSRPTPPPTGVSSAGSPRAT
jgi:HK97 family phage major capsid protein